MAVTKWISRCQWCGKQGGGETGSPDNGPPRSNPPMPPGKCGSHPSGNKDANHAPKWESR